MQPMRDDDQQSLRVSVTVPNYNGVRFLSRTLECLESQTYADLEVIVIDGGSTDGSVELIESWAERLPMRWVSEPDSGQAEAINKGFRMASGEVIAVDPPQDIARGHAKSLVDGLGLPRIGLRDPA